MTTPDNQITTVSTGSWSGILALLDTPGVNGQTYAPPQRGELATRELPASLLWQDNADPDNPTVHVVGSLTAATIEGQEIHGAGDLDMLNPATQRLFELAAGNPVPVALMIDNVKFERDETTGALTYTQWRITGALVNDVAPWPQATITLSAPTPPIIIEG